MATEKETSLLKQARELLRVTPKSQRTEALARATERFQECRDIFTITCTRTATIEMVGAATHLIMAIDVVGNPPTTPPRAGSGDTEKTLDKQLARA